MLPAANTSRISLADVLPNCLEALAGRTGSLGLPPVSHAVVVLVDGLGMSALKARSGHLRTLARRRDVDAPISAVFPTTTASGLASFATGVSPGRHGIVGYEVLEPDEDRIVNQLTGWDPGRPPPEWQRSQTLFAAAATQGVAAVAVGAPKFAASAFTATVLHGCEYRGATDMAERFAVARRVLAETERALVYLYVPELDTAGHKAGAGSDLWAEAAEELDAALAGFVPVLGPGQGMLVTADHGAVDVPREHHIIVAPALLSGVRHVGGEPRCLQVYGHPGADADALATRWRDAYGEQAEVVTRREAVAAGWFGEVDIEVEPRIGDVLVAARGTFAFYLDEKSPARGMVGQHGSRSSDETVIPLLRFGAFAG